MSTAQRSKSQADLTTDIDTDHQLGVRQENEREKSRLYLSKCSQEVAFHVIPTSHPAPDLNDLELSNHMYANHNMPQQSIEEAYIQQQRQKQQQQQQANHMMAREVALQNHQPIVTHYSDNSNVSRAPNQFLPTVARDIMDKSPLEAQQTHATAIDNRRQAFESGLSDERAGAAKQQYDNTQAAAKEETQSQQEDQIQDTDGWNFDENPAQESRTAHIPPHRPDMDAFPNANFAGPKSPSRGGSVSHRRKSSGSKRKTEGATDVGAGAIQKQDPIFKVRFALRGHLDVIRSVIFTGGGSPSEPEICTCSDDGTIKRWIIPASYGAYGSHGGSSGNDLDITSYFTHRGHVGAVTALAACSPSQNFSMVAVPWVTDGYSLVGRMPACVFGNADGLIPRPHLMVTLMLFGAFAFFLARLVLCLEIRPVTMEVLIGSCWRRALPMGEY